MSRSSRILVAGALVLLFGAPAAQATSTPAAPALVLPAGTAVNLTLLEKVTPRSVKVGRSIRAQVAGDVRIEGRVIIPDGAPATFEVTRSTTGMFLGQPDRLSLRASQTVAVNGERVLLRGDFDLDGQDRMVESLASYQVICCFFFLVPGDRVVLAAGTGWTATVAKDFSLHPLQP